MKDSDLLKFKEKFQEYREKNPPSKIGKKTPVVPPWIINCPELNPPFTWFGGKRDVADEVWKRFGADIPNYIEPFAGGLAVLLRRPIKDLESFEGFYETFNDQNLFLLNFWRAVQYGDRAKLVKYVDFPAHEEELLARRRYMMEQQENLDGEPETDQEFENMAAELRARRKYLLEKRDNFAVALDGYKKFDLEVAGLWLYVTRNWIGAGADDPKTYPLQKIPSKIKKSWLGGSTEAHITCLQQRLKGAMGFVGDWKRVVKSKTQTTGRGRTGVFLDPPYLGTEEYYAGFTEKKPERLPIAREVDEWALEKGDDQEFRIAVCGYEHNFNLDEYEKRGWYLHRWQPRIGFHSGKKDQEERVLNVEITAFSPHRLPTT